jgi:hypothetical protein
MLRSTALVALSLSPGSALVIGSSSRIVELHRAPATNMKFVSDENAGGLADECRILSDTQRKIVHELFGNDGSGNPESVIDDLVAECDEPSEDPSMTCAWPTLAMSTDALDAKRLEPLTACPCPPLWMQAF